MEQLPPAIGDILWKDDLVKYGSKTSCALIFVIGKLYFWCCWMVGGGSSHYVEDLLWFNAVVPKGFTKKLLDLSNYFYFLWKIFFNILHVQFPIVICKCLCAHPLCTGKKCNNWLEWMGNDILIVMWCNCLMFRRIWNKKINIQNSVLSRSIWIKFHLHDPFLNIKCQFIVNVILKFLVLLRTAKVKQPSNPWTSTEHTRPLSS